MIILGIHDGHCATAAVMVDGRLEALAAEERFTRLKNDQGYPVRAIDFCMKRLGLSPSDIDRVAFAGKRMNIFGVRLKSLSCFSSEDWATLMKEYWYPLHYKNIKDKRPFERLYHDPRFKDHDHFYDFSSLTWDQALEGGEELTRTIRMDGIKRHLGIPPEKVSEYDHHTCHAAYALFAGPRRDPNTMIYTLDGGGDGSTCTLFRFHPGNLQELARSNTVDIARIYRHITLMMGMKLGEHEYKVMGLAPYATEREVKKSYAVFNRMFTVENDLINYREGCRPRDLYFSFKEAFDNHRFDGIAAATQRMCEVAVSDWILSTQAKYGSHSLAFAGGVAMNVKLNMLLAESDEVDEIYVPPSPSDDTLSVGACYLAEASVDDKAWQRLQPVTDPYMGPVFGRRDILSAIASTGASDHYRKEEGVDATRIAEWLIEGKIVARLDGRMEFGQRALGNRSILADPRREDSVEKVNRQIKYRDFWMPFAPVILAERAGDYLKTKKMHICRDFMMIASQTTPLGARELAAAIHRGDKSMRPQIIRRDQNASYYDIIKEFEMRTGTGGLLNTSFNLHGEPIVCSPEDAISTFDRSELDVLVMEDVSLQRK